ncbi:hypothetical protein Tco_1155149 [Tanacetum coccineum]
MWPAHRTCGLRWDLQDIDEVHRHLVLAVGGPHRSIAFNAPCGWFTLIALCGPGHLASAAWLIRLLLVAEGVCCLWGLSGTGLGALFDGVVVVPGAGAAAEVADVWGCWAERAWGCQQSPCRLRAISGTGHHVVLDHLALGLDIRPVAAAVGAAGTVLVAFDGVAIVPVAVAAAAVAVVVVAAVRAGVGRQQHPEVQSSLLHREVQFSSSLP